MLIKTLLFDRAEEGENTVSSSAQRLRRILISNVVVQTKWLVIVQMRLSRPRKETPQNRDGQSQSEYNRATTYFWRFIILFTLHSPFTFYFVHFSHGIRRLLTYCERASFSKRSVFLAKCLTALNDFDNFIVKNLISDSYCAAGIYRTYRGYHVRYDDYYGEFSLKKKSINFLFYGLLK